MEKTHMHTHTHAHAHTHTHANTRINKHDPKGITVRPLAYTQYTNFRRVRTAEHAPGERRVHLGNGRARRRRRPKTRRSPRSLRHRPRVTARTPRFALTTSSAFIRTACKIRIILSRYPSRASVHNRSNASPGSPLCFFIILNACLNETCKCINFSRKKKKKKYFMIWGNTPRGGGGGWYVQHIVEHKINKKGIVTAN